MIPSWMAITNHNHRRKAAVRTVVMMRTPFLSSLTTAEDANISVVQIMVSQDPVDICLFYAVRALGLCEGLEAKCLFTKLVDRFMDRDRDRDRYRYRFIPHSQTSPSKSRD